MKDRTNGEHAAIDISRLAPVVALAVAVVMCHTIIITAKRKHRPFHIRQINEKAQIPATHIISNRLDPAAYKILKILHRLGYGQLHIYTVQDHQTQLN